MAVISPNPSIQDLYLTHHESTLLFPPKNHTISPPHVFLSNIDQILNYYIPTVFFFSPNHDYPPATSSQRIRSALQNLLHTYNFIAGRLKLNEDTGRLVIDCDDAIGAGFVVAASALTLAELGDLVCPNPCFRQLALQTLPDVDDQPLFVLQVTTFKCGGLAVGMSVNHILLDGLSAKAFNENLASQCFDDGRPLAVVPFLDRRLLSARSPPHADFLHPEFYTPNDPPSSGGPPVFDCKKEDLSSKVFKLTPADINFLKEKAREDMTVTNPKTTSSFNVTAALIWRCKALSSYANGCDRDRTSTLLNVVDLRSRVNPPLSPSYCGNAVLVAYASARCGDMEELAFGELVGMVGEGPSRVTEDYTRSVIDWLEINKGLPCGEYMVSSWARLGFERTEYPWGRPLHGGPLVNHRKDICWVFPTRDDDALNALVSLPEKEMMRFESEFLTFFGKL